MRSGPWVSITSESGPDWSSRTVGTGGLSWVMDTSEEVAAFGDLPLVVSLEQPACG